MDASFGSRHRAALGITEETDAVVVIVSEERGTISFCFNGNIASNLDGPKLRTMLETIFSPKVRRGKRKADAKRAGVVPAPVEVPSARRVEETEPSKPAPRVEVETPPSAPGSTPEPPASLKARPKIDSEPPAPLRPRPPAESEAVRTPAAVPLRTPAGPGVHLRTPAPAEARPSTADGNDSKSDPELDRSGN